jgi:hypothetical protein
MSIRTTITLDDDVIERVKEESKTRGLPFRTTVNMLLRIGLVASHAQKGRTGFEVKPFRMGLPQGVHKTSALIEMGEGEDYR